MSEWPLDFITEDDFYTHVQNTIIAQYGKNLAPYDVKKFNSNLIDPIKMVFDKALYGEDWETLIAAEIFRQRDKAGNNDVGYFHQKMFQYIKRCHVPPNGKEGGWDVIFTPEHPYRIDDNNRADVIYVEMKNKHNTMNSSGGSDTYIKMQDQLLRNSQCCCFLVEAIARRHQNIVWKTTINSSGRKVRVEHARIRRVSIDEFYSIVTGEENAFFQICMILPSVVEHVLGESEKVSAPHDTVIEQLKKEAEKYSDAGEMSMYLAMYMLGFSSYNGFRDYKQFSSSERYARYIEEILDMQSKKR